MTPRSKSTKLSDFTWQDYENRMSEFMDLRMEVKARNIVREHEDRCRLRNDDRYVLDKDYHRNQNNLYSRINDIEKPKHKRGNIASDDIVMQAGETSSGKNEPDFVITGHIKRNSTKYLIGLAILAGLELLGLIFTNLFIG